MGYSPDRVDATVWGFHSLFHEESDTGLLEFYQQLAVERQQLIKPKIPSNEGKRRMVVPPGVNQVFDREGNRIEVVDGVIFAPEELVGPFLSAGFKI